MCWISSAYRKKKYTKCLRRNRHERKHNSLFRNHVPGFRPDGDHRHDTEVKPELLANAGVGPKEVLCILEDRDSMVAKWRELGYRCLQVAEGKF